MRIFLLTILSLLVVFTYSCGGSDDDTEEKVECKIDKDCNDDTKFCNTENKCETKAQTGVLTSIEVDIDGVAGNKEVSLLLGEKKTVIAYGIYDNDVTETKDLSGVARWYSTNRDVGFTTLGSDGQTVKFEAKATGSTEIYCKYLGKESEHVTFNVSEGVISAITFSSKIGNSIFLHQAVTWDIIADLEGGNQIRLNGTDVDFHSTPDGLSLIENEYRFNNIGNYEVWVSKDSIDSNKISMEVKENVVVNIDLDYDRDDGEFFVATAHKVTVKELYEGNGESLLSDATGIIWEVKIKVVNEEDNTYTLEETVDGDYSVDGFNFTFNKAALFHVKASKVYGENTFTDDFEFNVKEATK